MKSYAETDVFKHGDLEVYRIARQAVEDFPDPKGYKPEPLRCHEVARAVHAVLLERFVWLGHKPMVIDGHFGGAEHSWIEIQANPKGHPLILDPYQPGAFPQVVLVDPHWMVPHRWNYRPGGTRTDIDHDIVQRLTAAALHRYNEPRPEKEPDIPSSHLSYHAAYFALKYVRKSAEYIPEVVGIIRRELAAGSLFSEPGGDGQVLLMEARRRRIIELLGDAIEDLSDEEGNKYQLVRLKEELTERR